MGEGLMLPCPKIVREQQQLTPEQEVYARSFARERIATLLSTTPVDEHAAEQHLRAAYSAVGLKPPTKIRWFDSPLPFARKSVRWPMWMSVWALVGDRVVVGVMLGTLMLSGILMLGVGFGCLAAVVMVYYMALIGGSNVEGMVVRMVVSMVAGVVTGVTTSRVAGGNPGIGFWMGMIVGMVAHLLMRILVDTEWSLRESVMMCVSARDEARANVMERTLARVMTSVEEGLRAYVSASVRSSVSNSVWDSVWNGMSNSVWDSVRNRMRASVRSSVSNSVWDIVWNSARNRMMGSMWWTSLENDRVQSSVKWSLQAYDSASSFARYRFFHEVFEKNELIHMAQFNELVSGYWLGKKEAWLVRKPVLLERDERGLSHSASSPCVQFRDGWSMYAWHGVIVPKKVIMHPEQLTRKDWINQSNVEVRRVIQERLGMERFVELMGGKCIDKGKRGRLIEVDLGNGPERIAHYVQVQDSSTERQYYLRVPPTITSADEAVAWTFGLDARDYQPGQET